MGPTRIDNQKCHLILETKIMNVYVDEYMYPLCYYFPDSISLMLATECHMKRICTWSIEFKLGENGRANIPSEELTLLATSNNESPKRLDSIGEQNLDNITKG